MGKKVSSLTDNWSPGPKTNSVEKINALRTGMPLNLSIENIE